MLGLRRSNTIYDMTMTRDKTVSSVPQTVTTTCTVFACWGKMKIVNQKVIGCLSDIIFFDV